MNSLQKVIFVARRLIDKTEELEKLIDVYVKSPQSQSDDISNLKELAEHIEKIKKQCIILIQYNEENTSTSPQLLQCSIISNTIDTYFTQMTKVVRATANGTVAEFDLAIKEYITLVVATNSACSAALNTPTNDVLSCAGSLDSRYVAPKPMPQASPRPSFSPPMAAQSPAQRRKARKDTEQSKKRSGIFGFFKRLKSKASKEKNLAPQMDSVRFSALAPESAVAGKYFPLHVLMYEDGYDKVLAEIAAQYEEKTKTVTDGYHDVERNAMIKVVLSSPDINVQDSTEVREWNGKYLDFEFVVKTPNDFNGNQLLFTATVYINDIIATRLKMILTCEKGRKATASIDRRDITSAFISYASQDRHRVATIIQGMKKVRPDMKIFFDVDNLSSGERWEEIIKSEIDNRDVLFLCWSRHARASIWVEKEWRYALESKGEDCIEPIPIETPDVCPPPAELKKKHFNDKLLYIIKATVQE